MAIADINVYLDQAADRAIDLRSQLKDAASALEDVLEAAEKAGKRIDDETGQIEADVDALVDRLEQVESSLAQARADAEEALGDVASESDAAVTDAQELVQSVRSQVEQVESAVTESDDELGTRIGAVATRAYDVNAAVAEAGLHLSQGRALAEQALAALGEAVSEGEASAQKSGEDMAVALKSAVDEIGQALDAWTDALGELVTDQTNALLDAANEVIRAHNAAMDQLKIRLSDDVRAAAEPSVDQLVTALQSLEDAATERAADLSTEAAGLDAWIEGTFRPQIADLSRRLRAAQTLG